METSFEKWPLTQHPEFHSSHYSSSLSKESLEWMTQGPMTHQFWSYLYNPKQVSQKRNAILAFEMLFEQARHFSQDIFKKQSMKKYSKPIFLACIYFYYITAISFWLRPQTFIKRRLSRVLFRWLPFSLTGPLMMKWGKEQREQFFNLALLVSFEDEYQNTYDLSQRQELLEILSDLRKRVAQCLNSYEYENFLKEYEKLHCIHQKLKRMLETKSESKLIHSELAKVCTRILLLPLWKELDTESQTFLYRVGVLFQRLDSSMHPTTGFQPAWNSSTDECDESLKQAAREIENLEAWIQKRCHDFNLPENVKLLALSVLHQSVDVMRELMVKEVLWNFASPKGASQGE